VRAPHALNYIAVSSVDDRNRHPSSLVVVDAVCRLQLTDLPVLAAMSLERTDRRITAVAAAAPRQPG